jgi:hypothetical protein
MVTARPVAGAAHNVDVHPNRLPRLLAPALALALAVAVPSIAPGPVAAAKPVITKKVEQRYYMDARYDTGTGRLRVYQRITLVNRSAHDIDALNLSVIPRALGSFSLAREVRVDGEAVSHAWTTTSNLLVRLGRVVAPGEEFRIGLTYKIQPRLQSGAFSARLAREKGVTSFGEWFPIVSREHDSYGVGDPQVSFNAESIEMELTTSTSMRRAAVACAGRKEAPRERGRHWRCKVTDVRDFAFTVNRDFHTRSRRVGDTTIRVYVETVGGGVTLDKAAFALSRFNDLYGKYPYPDLVLAEVGASGGFSMEYPRHIHLTRSKVNDTYVVYHEVAHQWFYGLLGNDQMREPWLDEGFSDFSTRYLMGVGANQCSSKNIDVSVFAFPAGLTSGGNWSECQGYFFSVFNKSTEMLTNLRHRMGNGDFFAAMRAHIAERRYGITTTRDVLDHLEAWDGADLLPVYREYTKRY